MDVKVLLKDAMPVIQAAAPTLATVLGGPALGASTQVAIGLLKEAFGVEDAATLNHVIPENDASTLTLKSLESSYGDLLKSLQLKMPSVVTMSIKFDWRDN